MLFLEIMRVALQAIRSNKMRSLLTMLGIVIGVAAVITMVSLGTGARRAVEEQIALLGANNLSVRPGQSMRHGVRSGSTKLTTDEIKAVVREARAITDAAPEMESRLQVEYGRNNANLRIIGTNASYPVMNNFPLQMGRFFDEQQNEGRRRVAVIGSAVPEELGATADDLLGSRISIRNISFEVVGVLIEKGGDRWSNRDDAVFIPVQTAQFRIMGTDRLSGANFSVDPNASMTLATAQIEEVLRREHRIRPGQDNDFYIYDRADLMGTRQETTRTFTFLLAGIAAVSLLVGGIGIMNIMLVSVTERTREIGVRMALGATRKNVLLQFLLEALVLCLAGGVIGILLGVGGSIALSEIANWNTAVSGDAVVLAVLFSATIGLFFGMWPARRAARLDPIEALRWE
jgi:putative ABC transport system permease protein